MIQRVTNADCRFAKTPIDLSSVTTWQPYRNQKDNSGFVCLIENIPPFKRREDAKNSCRKTSSTRTKRGGVNSKRLATTKQWNGHVVWRFEEI